MLDLNDYRWNALARYHNAAVEAGLILVALSRLVVKSHGDIIDQFGPRTTIRIMDEMHQFALSARKAIEISNTTIEGVKRKAWEIKVHNGEVLNVDVNRTITLTDNDFMWCISRIIHSQNVYVEENVTQTGATRTKIFSERTPAYFGFQSDFDLDIEMRLAGEARTVVHFVKIETLVAKYVGALSQDIELAIKRRRAGE